MPADPRLACNDSPQSRPQEHLRNRLLHGLPAAELMLLRPHLARVRLVSGQILHEPDQPVSEVFFMERGFASVMAMTDDRLQFVEIGLVGPEGMTGLPMLLGADSSVFNTVNVQMPGEAIRMAAGTLRTCLAEAPILQRRLVRNLESYMAQIAQTCACNSLHRTSERLARWLLSASDRADGQDLPLTQEFLSIMLATTRPVVTNAMLELAERGIVKYGRSRIQILDRNGLEAAACSCYGRLKTFTNAVDSRPEYDPNLV